VSTEIPDPVALLRRVNAVGGYFAVSVGAAPPYARPLAGLYDDAASRAGGPLADAVGAVGARMGTAEARVAASTLQLGIAARLWSVALGAAVLGGVVPDLDRGGTYWSLPASGPMELWLPRPRVSGASVDVADALYDVVAERHLAPLGRAVRAVTPVASGLLWGNAASALVGAARFLHAGLRRTDPSAARDALAFAVALLERGELRGTGVWLPAPPAFRRTSCCLYYRAGSAGLCGDCVLAAPPGRRRAAG